MINIDEIKNRNRVLIALSVIVFLISMDMISVNLILPAVANDFHTNLVELQWIITSYTLVSAVFTAISGKLGDMFGQLKILLIGLAIFSCASFLVALSYSSTMLIICRSVQGLGYAFIIALSNVIVAFIYPKDRIGGALGILAGVGALAAAIGPILVGLAVQYLSWRWVFFVNLPLCLFAFILLLRYCPKIPVVDHEKRFDYPGAFLMAISLTLTLLALNQVNVWGGGSLLFISTLSGGLLSFILFVIVEKYSKSPLLPLAIFTDKVFFSINLVRMIVSFVMSSLLFSSVFYLGMAFNYTSMHTGMVFLLVAVAMIISGVLSGAAINKVGPYSILKVGCLLLVLFYCYFAFIDSKEFGLKELLLYFVAGLAFGVLRPGISYIILRITPEKYLGVTNAISTTVLPVGAMLGVAISGWLLASRSAKYLHQLLRDNHVAVSGVDLNRLETIAQGIKQDQFIKQQVPNEFFAFAKQAFLYAYSELMLFCAVLFLISVFLLWYAGRKYTAEKLSANSVSIDPSMMV